MPFRWTFKCYTAQGVDEIERSYNSQTVAAQAVFDSRIRQLSQLDHSEWRRPAFDKLQAEDGLCEIRFKADKVEHRILGFFQPGHVFTMVMWMTKKGQTTKPKSAMETARLRKKEIEKDGSKSVEWDY